jgi:acyl-CoA synthetase (NDP forming)
MDAAPHRRGARIVPDLEFLFHPKSIAVVGAPSDPANFAGGSTFVSALLDSGYKGSIYPVNPKARQIMGLKCYSDLMSVPGAVDHVICCIPASGVHRLIEECSTKRVKCISMFTGGFSEADGHDRELERQLVDLAHMGGIRIIGPNCMGIHCPSTGLSYQSGHSKEPGSVAYLCQSGGNSNMLMFMGADRGIRFSKVVSYGNAADINESDLLEYFTEDVDTRVIAAYIEGTRSGPRFFRALANAAVRKPVIVLKGGLMQAGTRAARSHTGSLGGVAETWNALCRQAGAMQVHSLEQMLDSIETALYMKPPLGIRAGIVCWGGGASVLGTDACERLGLSIPPFTSRLREELGTLGFGPGVSVSNPVDSPVVAVPSLLVKAMTMIASSGEVDLLLVQLPLDISHLLGLSSSMWEAVEDALLKNSQYLGVPVAIVQPHTSHPSSTAGFHAFHQRCAEASLPLYPTLREAAHAICVYAWYHRWRASRHPST